MLNNLRAYMPRNEGNVSVMFAIAIVPLLLAAGSAIDYVRYNNTRTGVQAALDGAALAAALPASKSDNERIAIATEYFQSNFDGFSSDEYDFDVAVSDDTILANIRMKYPTTFLHLGGIANMDIDEQSEVMRPFAGKAEVALVLDYSLSMG